MPEQEDGKPNFLKNLDELIELLKTKPGRNKLRQTLGLGPEKEEEDE